MTERFYNISHLSTWQLRELYTTYIKRGWKDFDYYELVSEGVHPPELSDTEVILNLDAGHKYNYCVFMIDCEGEKDGIMFGFGLSYYPDFAAYLHLPTGLLDEVIEKYSLVLEPEVKDRTIEEFLVSGPKGLSLN